MCLRGISCSENLNTNLLSLPLCPLFQARRELPAAESAPEGPGSPSGSLGARCPPPASVPCPQHSQAPSHKQKANRAYTADHARLSPLWPAHSALSACCRLAPGEGSKIVTNSTLRRPQRSLSCAILWIIALGLGPPLQCLRRMHLTR